MPKASSVSVLIVDDQQSMRGISKYILNQLGFKDIIEAKSGRDALTKIEKANFDLIISDWNMDDIDGLTLLKVLQQSTRAPPACPSSWQPDAPTRSRSRRPSRMASTITSSSRSTRRR